MRSNSYNFIPVSDVPRPSGAACPVKRDGAFPYDGARELFLRLHDRMRLFRTRTTDFDDDELWDVKERRGQIYVDISKKLAPDDFAKDLKKIAPLAECGACERRAECGACWAPVDGSPFERDDEQVRALLRTLEGRLLDIGCGEGPYTAEIAPQVDAGTATYVGVDPDVARIDLLRSRQPWARYHVGTIADFADDPRGPRFDHVLILRSYNHLENPERTVERAASLLEPGGTLLVVDNVVYGLVRSREQAERAERGPAELEHHRNSDAAAAHEVISKHGFRVLKRSDVGPTTSNQWLLHYERTRDGGTQPGDSA